MSMRLYVSTGFTTLRITRDSQQWLRKEDSDADSQIVLNQAVLAIDAMAVGPVPCGVVEAALVGDDHLPEACVDSGGGEAKTGVVESLATPRGLEGSAVLSSLR